MQQKETDERGHDDPEEDVEDPDEWWRLLQDGGEQESYVPESILSNTYTPLQANRLMHAFRERWKSVGTLVVFFTFQLSAVAATRLRPSEFCRSLGKASLSNIFYPLYCIIN